MRRWLMGAGLALGLALLGSQSGCLVDSDARCNAHETYDSESFVCRCVDTAINVGGKCEPCPDGEVVSANMCVCPPGETRNASGACEELPPGLGASCVDSQACMDPAFDYCIDDGADGYCTSRDCTADAECPDNHKCLTGESPTYCEPPPESLGASCSDDDDCTAPLECESFITQSCTVYDCSQAPDSCPRGYECCDFTTTPGARFLCIPDANTGSYPQYCPSGS